MGWQENWDTSWVEVYDFCISLLSSAEIALSPLHHRGGGWGEVEAELFSLGATVVLYPETLTFTPADQLPLPLSEMWSFGVYFPHIGFSEPG